MCVHFKINIHLLLTHSCNPSYLGGRDQEDGSSKPALDKYFARPYLKKTHPNKGMVEWPKVYTEFKPQNSKKVDKNK
jgi:hypothetical protein